MTDPEKFVYEDVAIATYLLVGLDHNVPLRICVVKFQTIYFYTNNLGMFARIIALAYIRSSNGCLKGRSSDVRL